MPKIRISFRLESLNYAFMIKAYLPILDQSLLLVEYILKIPAEGIDEKRIFGPYLVRAPLINE